jgi:glycosyltransferase involved in cell wall biosynthesis
MTTSTSLSPGAETPPAGPEPATRPVRLAHRVPQLLIRGAIRGFLATYTLAVGLARLGWGRRRPIGPEGADILLTGTFHSDNWVGSHLRPLAQSAHCRRIRVVTVSSLPCIDKVEAIYPPAWLVQVVGKVAARLITFMRAGISERPDVVGGFHLLFNGLAAALLARMTGARSLYFCVGGPTEVLDGGLQSENRLFERLEQPDPFVERQLLRAVAACDLVVTMGTRAVRFFRQRGVETIFHVVPGGIDARRFSAPAASARTDLVFVGRLAPIKRVDIFLEVVARLKTVRPEVSAMVVGDGPLRPSLEAQARALGLERHVRFAGQQRDVEEWLRGARIFVLTSETEGLALAMMEAMLCGLPVVVPRVGDLADLVEDGVNGYLVRGRTPEAFAAPLLELLSDEDRRRGFGQAARRAAERYEVGATTRSWDAILGALVSEGAQGKRRCAA